MAGCFRWLPFFRSNRVAPSPPSRRGSTLSIPGPSVQRPEDKISTIIAGYTVKRSLGSGAFGEVFLATDEWQDEVAIKHNPDAFSSRVGARATYREVTYLRAFRKHPNIIQLHDIVIQKDAEVSIVLEYMDTDLDVIIADGLLNDTKRRFIFYQILAAVNYLHSGNVAHRDLKPENVLVDRTYFTAKVCDFGTARSFRPGANMTQGVVACTSQSGRFSFYSFGTTQFLAPELVLRAGCTTMADMWALGCLLYEMLTGNELFDPISEDVMMLDILNVLPTPTDEDQAWITSSTAKQMMIRALNMHSYMKRDNSLQRTLKGSPQDAVDMCVQLMRFSPNKRLAAQLALDHPYVALCREPDREMTMDYAVRTPLDDDRIYTTDEYKRGVKEDKEDSYMRFNNVKLS